jgi:hypothetical protein
MAPTIRSARAPERFDTTAWRFLRSEFADERHAAWPIERRLDAFLLHDGPREILADGSACDALLRRVMEKVGEAVRCGVLSSPRY